MNNRKQKVYSLLDSLTEKELENYLKDRKINLATNELLRRFKKYKSDNIESNHYGRMCKSVNGDLENIISKYNKLGMAWVIAFIFACFYDEKYKIKDIKDCLKDLIDDNQELKEYVYDIMKDF